MHAFYCRLGLHVLANDREVIRATRARLSKHARRDPAGRIERHKLYRAVLREHHNARKLHNRIIMGMI